MPPPFRGPARPAKSTQKTSSANKRCDSCGALNSAQATFCSMCHNSFSKKPPTLQEAAAALHRAAPKAQRLERDASGRLKPLPETQTPADIGAALQAGAPIVKDNPLTRAAKIAAGVGVGFFNPELGLIIATADGGRSREEKHQRELHMLAVAATHKAQHGNMKPKPPKAPQLPQLAATPDEGRWVCPRCKRALAAQTIGGLHLHACGHCGGQTIEADSYTTLLASPPESLTALKAFGHSMASARTHQVDGRKISYLPCPRCQQVMARRNFEQVSGVIVDRCPKHGVWFDGQELVDAIEFLQNGGAQKKRAFQSEEAERVARTRAQMRQMDKRAAARRGRGLPLRGHYSGWGDSDLDF